VCWAEGSKANQWVFASKTCRLEAALGVGSSHVYWFEGCQKSVEYFM
jgi:hypothetical protein